MLQIFKKAFLLISLLAIVTKVNAAYLENIPTVVIDADGNEIHCYSSGDEFFNYLHDEDGFTIIQGKDGYYYYGITDGDIVVPSEYRVNAISPKSTELKPYALISEKEYKRRVDAFWDGTPKDHSKAPHTGEMNNIVVYIRFNDDSEFTGARSVFDNRFNKPDGVSMKNYFQEVSYNQLDITSHHFPICDLSTNLSYQDIHPRSYYQPYNSSTNTNGYTSDNQRRIREHQLLQRAVEAVENEIPTELVIDADSDGFVDAVSFIIRGNAEGWSDLLWAHRWVLYTYDVRIHGKRVWDYTFQPQNQSGTYTIAHEMFHVLSAPDLYRYTNNFVPVGPWDLMASGFVHMGAHMKLKYANGKWISEIPTISEIGEYTLNPLTSSENNAYRINSPYSDTEYFVVEYRKREGLYEDNLPNSGLLVYRIDDNLNGNAGGPPDEIYLYRPNGTTTSNGNINGAALSFDSGNTSINDYTNPSSFLSDGTFGGLNITGITEVGETISFTLSDAGIYVIDLSTNPENGGMAIDQTNQSPYIEGTEVTLSASPFYGFDFENWTDGNGDVISVESTFVLTMPNHNVELIANFVEKSKQNVNFILTNQHGNEVDNAIIAVKLTSSEKNASSFIPLNNSDQKSNSFTGTLDKNMVQLQAVESNNKADAEKINGVLKDDSGAWIHWDNGINNTSIGTNSAAQFSIASRWEPEDLADYNGLLLSRISFFPSVENCEYTIKLWLGADAIEAYSQLVTNPEIGQWNTIDLDMPFVINASEELWFGVDINTQTGYPAGADEGPAIEGKGDLFKFANDDWVSIYNTYGININWNLQAYASDAIVKQSDNDGLVSFNLVEGEYTFTIQKYNYETYESTFTITDEDIDLDITLTQGDTYSITFIVKDEDENAIEGASLIFDEEEFTTSSDGIVLIENLDPNTYSYSITKEGFLEIIDEVELVDEDVIVDVTLIEIPTYVVTFTLVDSDGSVEGATLTFDQQSYTSDSNGLVVIDEVVTGTYPYTVTKDGYFDVSDEIVVDHSDVNETVTLIQSYSITFSVNDSQGAVPDASISINGSQYTTNNQGFVEISGVESGTYPYTVSKEGYLNESGQVIITDSDVEETVTLTRIYTVTINVVDSQGAISGATVTFDGDNYTTDSDGDVVIDQVESGTYNYSAAKDDYHEVSGEIIVDNTDVEITVSLTPVSASTLENSSISIFPNPFSSNLHLKNLNNAASVTITNVIGQRMLYIPVSDENMVINTSSLPRGVYLLTIEFNNNQREARKIIKN